MSDVRPVPASDLSSWDLEADVVMVGLGATGASAAIEAVEVGADTLVLEAASAGGGTSAMSGGLIYLGGGTPIQRECGFEDSFTNAPDILVHSFYDPHADEGAAFEEVIGFDGGMGGKQANPFLLFPASFELPEESIVGGASVHHVFKRWMAETNAGKASVPWTVPERPAKTPVPAREI